MSDTDDSDSDDDSGSDTNVQLHLRGCKYCCSSGVGGGTMCACVGLAVLPPASKAVRAVVHRAAEEHGLWHDGVGDGAERHVQLCRHPPPPRRLRPLWRGA